MAFFRIAEIRMNRTSPAIVVRRAPFHAALGQVTFTAASRETFAVALYGNL